MTMTQAIELIGGGRHWSTYLAFPGFRSPVRFHRNGFRPEFRASADRPFDFSISHKESPYICEVNASRSPSGIARALSSAPPENERMAATTHDGLYDRTVVKWAHSETNWRGGVCALIRYRCLGGGWKS